MTAVKPQIRLKPRAKRVKYPGNDVVLRIITNRF